MDQFAQSREDDDLFGDDFEPVSAPTIIESPIPIPSSGPGSSHVAGLDGQRNGDSRDYRAQGRGRGAHRGQERGRGRGRGGQVNSGLAGSRYAPKPQAQSQTQVKSNVQTAPAPVVEESSLNATSSNQAPESPIVDDTTTPAPADKDASKSSEPSTTQTVVTATNATDEQSPQPTPPQPQPQPQHRTTSVRGDRSLTGGPAKAKLTEAELTEKMAKMAILNAQKTEKFRRTEADSAAFLQKEAEMKKKRIEEQKNAREMDKERARNRERKLKAQGGREWDLEKTDADIVSGKGRGRSSEYVRGGHGGVIRGAGLGGSRYADDDGVDSSTTRGRGGFEIRGRGNRGRGGRGGNSNPVVPRQEDFPSLPAVVKPPEDVASKPTSVPNPVVEETVKSPAVEEGGHDWAEEMATPVEEKKLEV